ncbi:MAG TPA: hypothetical protein VM823_10805 [Gaiellales bacterium]|nr:hypothetical protein [Gaiellales bacterium]
MTRSVRLPPRWASFLVAAWLLVDGLALAASDSPNQFTIALALAPFILLSLWWHRVWDTAGRPQRNWPLRFKLAIPSIALVVAALVVWAASGNRSAFLGIVLVAFACTTITDDFVQRRELRNNGV